MRELATVLLERLGLALLVAAAAASLHYYGRLNFQSSLLLGVAFSVVAMWLYLLKQVAMFKPYRLIIGINYEALWEDLKLTPAEGPKFENVTLTAISAAIFVRSDERAYSTRLDLYKDIPCGAPTWTAGFGGSTDNPTFFLRPSRDGYQFGVQVEEEWWKLHNSELAAPLHGKPLASYGNLVLGLLPYGYMPEHTRRLSEPVSLWYGFNRKQRRWKERLQQEGWTFDDDYPNLIRHRYLGIGYYEL